MVFAQQLTMFEWKLFTRLQTKEFFHLSWSKEERKANAYNVCRMIHWSNIFGNWISRYIMECKQVQKRANRLCKIITLIKV